jgi:hypothetical protein
LLFAPVAFAIISVFRDRAQD